MLPAPFSQHYSPQTSLLFDKINQSMFSFELLANQPPTISLWSLAWTSSTFFSLYYHILLLKYYFMWYSTYIPLHSTNQNFLRSSRPLLPLKSDYKKAYSTLLFTHFTYFTTLNTPNTTPQKFSLPPLPYLPLSRAITPTDHEMTSKIKMTLQMTLLLLLWD